MMTFVEFAPCHQEHIRYITPQEHDIFLKEIYLNPINAHIFKENFCISAWAQNKCIGAAGIIHLLPHRALAWSFLGKDAGPYLHKISTTVKRALDMHPAKRIEMTVGYDFSNGHRWAKMLGFEVDAPRMRHHALNGGDETLYARIKHG